MGGETVFRPFVLILTFICLAGFLLVGFKHMFSASSTMEKPEDLTATLGCWEITLFSPTYGANVTNSTIYNRMPTGETGGFAFDSADKRVYVVRDNLDYKEGSTKVWERYNSYIGIKRTADDLVGGKVYRYSVSLNYIVAHLDRETNVSRVDFTLSGSNYTLFVKTMDNNTRRIWWNNYTVYLGKNILQSNKVDFWSAIRMVMFAEIPNCDKTIAYMISTVVDFSFIFVIFTLASRIIPFISGG